MIIFLTFNFLFNLFTIFSHCNHHIFISSIKLICLIFFIQIIIILGTVIAFRFIRNSKIINCIFLNFFNFSLIHINNLSIIRLIFTSHYKNSYFTFNTSPRYITFLFTFFISPLNFNSLTAK